MTEIRLRSGVTLRAPRSEPLPFLLKEIWAQQVYGTIPGSASARSKVVVDIGAHVGVFAVWAATQPSRPRVIAVEPAPRMVQFLGENVRINRLENVTIVCAACGARQGEAVLHLAAAEMMNSLYERNGTCSDRSIAVPMVTLDQLFADHHVERCDLLKIDCEGAEFEILLEGCSDDTLRQGELHQHGVPPLGGSGAHGPAPRSARAAGLLYGTRGWAGLQHGHLRATRDARAMPVTADDEKVASEAPRPAAAIP